MSQSSRSARQELIAKAAALNDHGYMDTRETFAKSLEMSVEALDRETGKIILRAAHEIVAERREPAWLIHKILEANVLAVLAGQRQSLKSFLALHWAMCAASAKKPAVILSGEGAGLDRRIDAWMRQYSPNADLAGIPLYALERPLNLNADTELSELGDAIESRAIEPTLIIVDTFSKFSPGLDENSNSDVSRFLSMLSIHLRERFQSTVLLVAHSGHGETKRPRGAYALMANPDCEFIVDRPDMEKREILVSRERFKDSPALEPLSYRADIIDLQRFDSSGDRVTSLALIETPTIERHATLKEPRGKAQRELLAHLRSIKNDGPGVWTLGEMRQMGKTLGQPKGTARSAVDWLMTSGYMTRTIGGNRLSDDAG